ARARLGQVGAAAWDPTHVPAPADALAGRDAVVHLAGENVAQRWTPVARERIRASRELGTRNLVAGLRAADPRPGVLVSASGVGYYGRHGGDRHHWSARGAPAPVRARAPLSPHGSRRGAGDGPALRAPLRPPASRSPLPDS